MVPHSESGSSPVPPQSKVRELKKKLDAILRFDPKPGRGARFWKSFSEYVGFICSVPELKQGFRDQLSSFGRIASDASESLAPPGYDLEVDKIRESLLRVARSLEKNGLNEIPVKIWGGERVQKKARDYFVDVVSNRLDWGVNGGAGGRIVDEVGRSAFWFERESIEFFSRAIEPDLDDLVLHASSVRKSPAALEREVERTRGVLKDGDRWLMDSFVEHVAACYILGTLFVLKGDRESDCYRQIILPGYGAVERYQSLLDQKKLGPEQLDLNAINAGRRAARGVYRILDAGKATTERAAGDRFAPNEGERQILELLDGAMETAERLAGRLQDTYGAAPDVRNVRASLARLKEAGLVANRRGRGGGYFRPDRRPKA